MLRGFKEFVLRGNVLDLAIAVVTGGAFGAVATALVKDVITPLRVWYFRAQLGHQNVLFCTPGWLGVTTLDIKAHGE